MADTYTRANNTELSATEVGALAYGELNTSGGNLAPQDIARIESERLRITGPAGSSTDPGMVRLANLGFDLDVTAVVTMLGDNYNRLAVANDPVFIFRQMNVVTGKQGSKGIIQLDIRPNGTYSLRAATSSPPPLGDGAAQVVADAPIGPAFAAADTDGDGILESNEPFSVAARIFGDTFCWSINGVQVGPVLIIPDAAMTGVDQTRATNFFMGRNRWLDGAIPDLDIAFDDLVITAATEPCAPPNQPPVAADDSYATDEDTTLIVAAPGVLGNDSDVDGDSLSAVLVSEPSNGTLALNADGSFGYKPNANFHGADAFTYRANDGTADSDIATVTVTVNAVNDQPVAIDDAASAAVGTPQAIGVLANDTDIDGDALVVAVVTQGTFGSVVNNGGDVTYTADNVFGSLIAWIGALPLNNGQKNSLLAKLRAAEQSFARGNRTAGNNQLGALINEVDALKRSGRLDPGLADSLIAQVLAIQSGNLVDTFTYTVGDGNSGSDTATVTVSVTWD